MSNKYNKALRYRRNHQLIFDTFESSGFFSNLVMGAIIAIILLIFKVPYVKAFKSFDFAMLSSFLFYQLILRPKIYRGEIKAYYRRNYKKLLGIITLYAFVGVTSMWRFLIFSSLKAFENQSIAPFITNNYHQVASLSVMAFSILLFYFTYYNDRYTTIKEYSNGINFKIKEYKMSENDAIWQFGLDKDKEYDIKEFRGTYYDYENKEEIKKKEEKTEKKKEENIGIRREKRQL